MSENKNTKKLKDKIKGSRKDWIAHSLNTLRKKFLKLMKHRTKSQKDWMILSCLIDWIDQFQVKNLIEIQSDLAQIILQEAL